MGGVTKREYVNLIKQAEASLIKAGHSSIEKRVHMLTSIYYGSTWSLDFKVEASAVRNKLFEQFINKSFDTSDDPRPALGTKLFAQLQGSQDAGGVDMGHLLIGLDARMRTGSREGTIFGFGASGLELVTWAGDLGGGSARLAFDEADGAKGNVERYFRGTDYGADSNLEGDIAAYVVGSLGKKSLDVPTFAGGTVAGALDEYFLSAKNKEWSNRKLRFQEIISGTASASSATFAPKIEAFSRAYYATRVTKDKATDWEGAKKVAEGVTHLHDASGKVADRFMTWLNIRHSGSKGAH